MNIKIKPRTYYKLYEEPLQAYSAKQALHVLIRRYEKRRPGFNKFEILNAFRDGNLTYDIDVPYQWQKYIKNTPPKPTSKPKKQDEYQQMSFKGMLNKNDI